MQATWIDLFVLLLVLVGVVLLLCTKPPQVMHFLPESSDVDTVYVSAQITADPIYAIICPHTTIVPYRRTDWRARSTRTDYSGTVCVDCGRIFNEKKES